VDNLVAAEKERRQLDIAERTELDNICQEMWANLTPDYHWLREWQYV
jgi:hypothetical protein